MNKKYIYSQDPTERQFLPVGSDLISYIREKQAQGIRVDNLPPQNGWVAIRLFYPVGVIPL